MLLVTVIQCLWKIQNISVQYKLLVSRVLIPHILAAASKLTWQKSFQKIFPWWSTPCITLHRERTRGWDKCGWHRKNNQTGGAHCDVWNKINHQNMSIMGHKNRFHISTPYMNHKCFFYLRFDWISISRLNWCSTPALSSWDFLITLIATMNLLFLSLARYTSPNFPRPRGLPISKSLRLHCRPLRSNHHKTPNSEYKQTVHIQYTK